MPMRTQLTKNQSLVFNVLARAEAPLSAYSILDLLREQGFRAPLQVYRALEKLLDVGLVHRLDSINAFVACTHPDEDCHAHGFVAFAICDKCGSALEFHDHELDDRLLSWLRKKSFTPGKATIEVRGHCVTCS